MTTVPNGFQTITPYFFCDEPIKFAKFLADAFAGKEIGRTEPSPGFIANLQIKIGTVTVMISQSSEELPATNGAYYLYVADADQSTSQAIAAGAILEMEVQDMPYGDRQSGVRDPFGNLWWVSQRLVDGAYHESKN